MTGKFANLAPRVFVALVAIPLILAVSYFGGIWFLLFVSGIGVLALLEFFTLFPLYLPLQEPVQVMV